MRYTEARLAGPAEEMLADLDKETVDFGDNYDGTRQEPVVLPSKFPNLLVNGSEGIAVGMATRLLPHNLNEICDAIIATMDNPDITADELMEIVPGPDFPTGGVICGTDGTREARQTGHGSLVVRGKLHVEETRSGRAHIVVDEIPYGVLLPTIKDRLLDAVQSGTLRGIEDLRDESGRQQMVRLVIVLKKDANPQVLMNQLWRYTPLQSTLHALNIALVNRVPRTLNLKQLIEHFVRHRGEVIRRRTGFLLRKALQRRHVVEGLLQAISSIDEVIRVIRTSPDADAARQRLMEKPFPVAGELLERMPNARRQGLFADPQRPAKLTHTQADAILGMQLRRLTALEVEQLDAEFGKLCEQIADYELILSDERRVLDIIAEDLREMKEKYGQPRRTEIGGLVGALPIEQLVEREEVVVTISHEGYIKRVSADTYREQGRGGRGVRGTENKDGDFIEHIRVCSTHDYLLVFTNRGRVYWLRVYDIPSMSRTSRGRSLANAITMQPNEHHMAVLAVQAFEEKFVFYATEKGVVKKTPLTAFSNPRPSGIQAITLDPDDSLVKVSLTSGEDEIILGSRLGMACRFKEEDVRAMGRSARGVRGITLGRDDCVVDMVVIQPGRSLLTVCENGFGKRTPVEEYRLTRRGGKGVINIRTSERNGPVVALRSVTEEDSLILITAQGNLMRMPLDELREIGRATQGVRLIRLDEGDRVVAVARVVSEEEEPEAGSAAPEAEEHRPPSAAQDEIEEPPPESGLEEPSPDDAQ
jgi:DNA gyrase subunit A